MAKKINVSGTVLDVQEKQSQKGTTYWSVQLKETTGNTNFWNAFDEKPKVEIGDEVKIEGTMNQSGDKTFRNIKKVKVTSDKPKKINKQQIKIIRSKDKDEFQKKVNKFMQDNNVFSTQTDIATIEKEGVVDTFYTAVVYYR